MSAANEPKSPTPMGGASVSEVPAPNSHLIAELQAVTIAITMFGLDALPQVMAIGQDNGPPLDVIDSPYDDCDPDHDDEEEDVDDYPRSHRARDPQGRSLLCRPPTASRRMTPQTPPTDRPLTAGDWIEWHGGENPVPGQMVEVRLGMGTEIEPYPSDDWDWSYRETDQVNRRITAYRLSRPATSAASEVEGVDRVMAVLNHWFDGRMRVDRNSEMVAQLAALASPPVSERERELEGADEFLAYELVRDQHGPSYWYGLTDEGRKYYVSRFSDAIKRANAARPSAITAQPAGEPTHG